MPERSGMSRVMDRRLLTRGLILRCMDGLLRLRQKVADRLVNRPIEYPPLSYMVVAWILGLVALLIAWRLRQR